MYPPAWMPRVPRVRRVRLLKPAHPSARWSVWLGSLYLGDASGWIEAHQLVKTQNAEEDRRLYEFFFPCT